MYLKKNLFLNYSGIRIMKDVVKFKKSDVVNPHYKIKK